MLGGVLRIFNILSVLTYVKRAQTIQQVNLMKEFEERDHMQRKDQEHLFLNIISPMHVQA